MRLVRPGRGAFELEDGDPFSELRKIRRLQQWERRLARPELQGRMFMGYGSGAAAFAADSADFDGTNDGLTRSATMTGQAASKSCTISLWYNADTLPATSQLFFARDAGGGWNACTLTVNSSGDLSIATNTDGVGFAFRASTTSAPITTGAGWQWIGISWDGAAGVQNVYVNAAAPTLTLNSNNNANTSWDNTDSWHVGEGNAGALRCDGQMAEFYCAPGQYIDFSVQANREKFRSAAGKAVSLGATGSTPTGSAPLIYLHLDDAETANNFATNRAGNGNFTVSGALSTGASSPTD